jgi:hypothetical protein
MSLECQGLVEEKLKIPGDDRLLRRRRIVSKAYTWIGVQTT